jgi:hypothetical protein
MSNRNRVAGHNYERQIVNELKSIGFEDVVTARAESRNMDDKGVDIFGSSLPFFVQCKNSQNYPKIHELLSSELVPKEKPLIVFHKKTKKHNTRFITQGEYIYLNKEVFYNLINLESKIIEIACNLAHNKTLFDSGDICQNEDDMYQNPELRVLVYKEEIQDRFNANYDYYYTELCKILKQ